MSVKELKAYMASFIQEWNKGKAAAIAAIGGTCAANCVFHSAFGEDIHGLKDLKQFASELFDAFPDSHYTIEDMMAEGNKLVMCYVLTGTHKGEFRGIPATNKKVTISVIYINHIVHGKFVEGSERYDTLGLMQQLGVTPTSGKRR